MDDRTLLPCPFCGGPVTMERTADTWEPPYGERKWWGIICRNTTNRGGTCAVQIAPSASPEAASDRWNMRNGVRAAASLGDARPCAGANCGTTTGQHSAECIAEHARACAPRKD
jgi:hypothetical protein